MSAGLKIESSGNSGKELSGCLKREREKAPNVNAPSSPTGKIFRNPLRETEFALSVFLTSIHHLYRNIFSKSPRFTGNSPITPIIPVTHYYNKSGLEIYKCNFPNLHSSSVSLQHGKAIGMQTHGLQEPKGSLYLLPLDTICDSNIRFRWSRLTLRLFPQMC